MSDMQDRPEQTYETSAPLKWWKRLRRRTSTRWALRLLGLLLFMALFADFIANERPIYCKIEGQSYFPLFRYYAVESGITHWQPPFNGSNWDELPYQSAVKAIIPYSSNTIDGKNRNYASPFGAQNVASWRYRHWLGTDRLGRDVAAGMVAGARTAILVGVVAMAIATLIGILLGAVAGYFGDSGLRISRSASIFYPLSVFAWLFYAFVVPAQGAIWATGAKAIIMLVVFVAATWGLVKIMPSVSWLKRKVVVPADILVMRLIEIFNSVPPLLLILSVVVIFKEPSLLHIMAIIGLIRWTGIARFLRGELLRIRQLGYIEAGKALGYSDWRILWRHALPNAISPVLIAVAFGIANTVLLEAFLSFLGIGLPSETVTWGTLLNESRSAVTAWWLAVFPGLAIFTTVTIFNLLGEGLTEALDPKMRE